MKTPDDGGELWSHVQTVGANHAGKAGILPPSVVTPALWIKALGGLAFLIAVLALLLVGPAGPTPFREAWIYLAIFFLWTAAITLDLTRRDPGLLQRRVAAGPTAEQRGKQKVIQFFAQVAFLATMVVPALDHRFGWSALPLWVEVAGDGLVALGFSVVSRVFRANSYASATIEVDRAQRVIDTGPYARVRHPMYSGALILLLGTPLALGSAWGLVPVAVLSAVIVMRLLDEERFLATDLEGYLAYCDRVRWRLVPGLF